MNVWTILFDLDDTLVMTSEIEELREEVRYGKSRWSDVYNQFDSTFLYPDTLELIRVLKRGIEWRESIIVSYDIGVVTSSPREYAEKLLTYHNLDIPVLSAYNDTRNHKPAPDPIINAMEKLDAEPSKTIYVGDTEDDVQASLLAGCIPFLFDPDLSYFGTSYIKRLVREGGRLVADGKDFLESLGEIHGALSVPDEVEKKSLEASNDTFFSEYGLKNLKKRKDLEEEGYDIFFRYIYYPVGKRSDKNKDYSISNFLYSSKYINLKEMYSEPIKMFSESMEQFLNPDSNFVICVAPSRREGLRDSGERLIANELCNNLNVVDGTNCIKRISRTPKFRSNYDLHLESIEIQQPSKLYYKNVLILDNIVSSGATLKACIDRVKEAGAKSVVGLAIAKTWGRDEN